MLQPWLLLLLCLAYLGGLFAIAYYGDRHAMRWRRAGAEPYVYALSLAIYCTAWTFYGSVGRVAARGLDFALIYVGPAALLLLCYPLVRKMLSVGKRQNVTSIADFVGARYGKSRLVAAFATLLAIVGVLPYIALQLQAVSHSFAALAGGPEAPGAGWARPWRDTALWVALVMVVFSILFGVRNLQASERHHGMILAIAFESLVKLAAILAVGVFVLFGLFEGPADLAAEMRLHAATVERIGDLGGLSSGLAITAVAAFAFLCLPRQFHVAVVECGDPESLRTARWLFPLYLLAINLFVPLIAFAGLLRFGPGAQADLFVLTLPVAADAQLLSLLVFIGGLSAATSMVIVASVALSTMVCNELVVPLLLRHPAFRAARSGELGALILWVRRAAILGLVLLAYGYYAAIAGRYSLASIGLISFCAVAQFAPAVVLGLYWRRAHRHGALAGMAGGTAVWVWMLLLPSLGPAGGAADELLTAGIALSLLVNLALLVGVSLLSRPAERDRRQAEAFVAGLPPPDAAAPEPERAASFDDLRSLAARFLGEEHAARAFAGLAARAPGDLAQFTEHLLSGVIGAASARVVVAAVLRRHGAAARPTRAFLDTASEAVLSSLDLLRTTLETVSQGIAVFDRSGRLTARNRRFLVLFGLDEATARIGAPLAGLAAASGRSDPAARVDLAGLLAGPAGPPHGQEGRLVECRRADGRVLEIQTSAMPDGGFVLVGTDVTERVRTAEALRESQDRIRVYTDNVPVLMAYVDRDERYRFTNRPYDEALGLPPGRTLGMSLLEALGEARYRRLKPRIAAAFAGERQTFEIEFPFGHGGFRLAEGLYIPHRDDSGRVLGFFTLYRDVTEQRRAENALREAKESLERRVAERTRDLTAANAALAQAKAAAEEANLGKTRFLAAASHDLLQPLHAARLFAATLAEQTRRGRNAELVRQLDSALGSVEELLQALLEISKLDAGALKPEPRPVPVGEMLASLAGSFAPMAAARGLRLRAVPCRAVAVTDPRLLRRILQNFLSNAVRYTRRGGVLIGCRRRGRDLAIEVWDTGPGIPADKIEAIFEEFRRLDEGAADSPAGLGLGLAIVRRIGRMLGHRVTVRSRPGRGSVFAVTVPLAEAAPPAREAAPAAARRPPDALAGRVVLCLDDDRAILAAMRALLERWSCTVLAAADLDGAVAAIEAHGGLPDILLVDHRLSDRTTGLDALDALAARYGPLPPAVLITANYTEEVRAAAAARGCPVLNKPAKPAALRALMSRLLAARPVAQVAII